MSERHVCDCDHPLIKCDHRGCRCQICGRLEDRSRLTAFSDETGRERVTADMLRAARRKAPKFWRDYDGSQQHMRGVIEAALSASPVAQEPVAAAILETLREHHNWHLQAGTIGLQDGDGGWIEIDNGAEYTDSALYERTAKLLEGAPPEEHQPMPRGGMNTWWWEQAVLLRRKVRALEKAAQATSAGLGADEIARLQRCLNTLRPFTSRPIGGEGSPARLEQQDRAKAFEEATTILALLSRAGDQSNSTHEA